MDRKRQRKRLVGRMSLGKTNCSRSSLHVVSGKMFRFAMVDSPLTR